MLIVVVVEQWLELMDIMVVVAREEVGEEAVNAMILHSSHGF